MSLWIDLDINYHDFFQGLTALVRTLCISFFLASHNSPFTENFKIALKSGILSPNLIWKVIRGWGQILLVYSVMFDSQIAFDWNKKSTKTFSLALRLGQTSATFRPTNLNNVGDCSALLDIVGCRGGQTNPTFHPTFVDLQQKQQQQPEA